MSKRAARKRQLTALFVKKLKPEQRAFLVLGQQAALIDLAPSYEPPPARL